MTTLPIRVELTKDPKPKTAENELGFGKVFTDHMFVMDWNAKEGWHDARIVPYAPLELDPACGALHYGQAIFEGLKAYNNEGRITLFRPDANFARLNNSAERMVLPQLDAEFALEALKELLKVEKAWVPTSENTSLYIRPLLFNNENFLGVHPAENVRFLIMLSPSGSYFKGGLQPVSIFVEQHYVRAVQGGVGFAKTAGNYAASMMGQVKAQNYGCSQCLWLDGKEHKYVEEVGAMNIFFKIKGKFYTPALTGSILPGITRDSMIQVLRDKGEEVIEARIEIDTLFDLAKTGELEEVFGTGTAAVISPVGKLVRERADGTLEEAVVNNNEPGPASVELYNTLTGIQLGKLEDKFGWVVEVCKA